MSDRDSMPNHVSVYALGVGDAHTVENWCVNLVVTINERDFVVDCPAYIAKMLAFDREHGDRGFERTDYTDLIITHLHSDHAGGLEELACFHIFETGERVRLYAPQWLLRQIWILTLQGGYGTSYRGDGGLAALDWYFEPIPLEDSHDFGDFTLKIRDTRHIPRTFALKFDCGNFRLGYSSDTGPDDGLIGWFEDCDVVIHEVWLGPTMALGGDIRCLHTPLDYLLQLPEEFQRKTLLCHYSDDWRDFEGKIGAYRFLQQNRIYQLVKDGEALDGAMGSRDQAADRRLSRSS